MNPNTPIQVLLAMRDRLVAVLEKHNKNPDDWLTSSEHLARPHTERDEALFADLVRNEDYLRSADCSADCSASCLFHGFQLSVPPPVLVCAHPFTFSRIFCSVPPPVPIVRTHPSGSHVFHRIRSADYSADCSASCLFRLLPVPRFQLSA